MKEIILIGGGGHCRSCIDVLEQEAKYNIAGIVDVAEKKGELVFGYEIIAEDADLFSLVPKYKNFLITLGQIKDSEPRKRVFQKIDSLGGTFPVIISPSAYISKYAKIGKGTTIMPHAVVNAGATVGENCIVNTKAVVEHDAVIGDHCHLATGSIVNGGAHIGNEVFLGSGSVVREYVNIGERNVIGCQVAVRKNITADRGVFF